MKGHKRVRRAPFPCKKKAYKPNLKTKAPFFKRYSRWFSIAGFVIVLLTYVVKEVFQDQLKELRDSLTEAQRTVDMGNKSYAESMDQVALTLRITQLKNQMAGQMIGGPPARGNIPEEIAEANRAYSSEETQFNNISDMLDRLPGPTGKLKAERDRLRKELDAVKGELNENAKLGLTAKNPNVGHDVLILVGILKVTNVGLECVPLQIAVTESAERVKEIVQRRYDEWTYTGWSLFMIGWILGLGGSVYGWKTAE